MQTIRNIKEKKIISNSNYKAYINFMTIATKNHHYRKRKLRTEIPYMSE